MTNSRNDGTLYDTMQITLSTTMNERTKPWMTRGSVSSMTLTSRLNRLSRRPVGVVSNHCSG